MQPYRRFHFQYRERLSLPDGTWAELRMVRPEDAALLRDGFERLSPRSRFQRFLSAKPRLSEEELHYLTRVDGERHVALGAVTWSPAGREVGLGLARFFRLTDAPEVAEVAITVVDEAQGKGLGRILMDKLVEAARERGVERFEFRVLAGNLPMYKLVQMLAPCEPEQDDDAVCFSVPLAAPTRGGYELRSVLALAAQGALTLIGPTCRWRGLPRVTPPVAYGEEVRSS
ncbi:GNAT family N-acetyltransferase [Archangium sp.]|uniref:GNAT family N-acetyltransferase n=1 Tax=Archangium sp. TaxID=1872627 RepID=UPI002D4F5927|nr:GNAT family N-acetyltransferase [Archangium sp.]HYO53008.1 GNAT family N-acetyltransferase [Archangium sp.]